MDKINYIDQYLRWLKENMSVRNLGKGISEITAPFLDRHNDYIQIYAEMHDDGIRLSDDGYTIADLLMSGVDVSSGSRKKYLMSTLNGFGVSMGSDYDLFIDTTLKDYAQRKHALIQCMLAVNDLYVIGRSSIVSLFIEDCRNFLAEHDIRFTSDVFITGKSGYQHKYEFVIPSSKIAPERFVKPINLLSKSIAENIIVAWSETVPQRNNSKLYTIINDQNKVSDREINALENYGIGIIPYSSRNLFVDQLAS